MPAVFRSWLRLSSQLVSIHCLLNSSRFYSVFTRFHGFHSISRFPLAFSISNSISTQFLNRFLVISTRFHGIYFILTRFHVSSTRFHVNSTFFLSISLYFTLLSTQWTPNRLLLCQHTPMPTSWNRLRLLNLRSPKSSDIWTLRKRNAMTT